jgi:hypothetical protein
MNHRSLCCDACAWMHRLNMAHSIALISTKLGCGCSSGRCIRRRALKARHGKHENFWSSLDALGTVRVGSRNGGTAHSSLCDTHTSRCLSPHHLHRDSKRASLSAASHTAGAAKRAMPLPLHFDGRGVLTFLTASCGSSLERDGLSAEGGAGKEQEAEGVAKGAVSHDVNDVEPLGVV